LSVDPGVDTETAAHQPQGWNRYAYTMNNPIKAVDPDGRETIVIIAKHYYIGDHAGLIVGRGNDRVLYDPGGTYNPPSAVDKGEPRSPALDKFDGDGAQLGSYMNYQGSDGSDVEIVIFKTTLQEENDLKERINKAPDSVPAGGCAANVSAILNGVGPFKNLGEFFWPRSLLSELKKEQKEEQKEQKVKPVPGVDTCNGQSGPCKE
jgi:hypothetical protein